MTTVVTWRLASPAGRAAGRRWLAIFLITNPVYVTLKNIVALTALLREVASVDEWVVTARTPERARLNAQASA
jgi:hypothetical protein